MFFAKQVEKMYRAQMFARYDENGTVFYFSAEDFEGLHKVPYEFSAAAGHKLQGYFYSYDEPIEGRLIVFDHGLGGGHRAYMKEIEKLARHGFLVFAYDHTGCMESGGENTNGFAQSLSDLNCCINALKADEKYRHLKISVVGHSWGAFSCMNIDELHRDICHVAAMSGSISVEQMLRQMFTGPMSVFIKSIYKLESQANPEYVKFNAVETLKNTAAKVLLIHSADDNVVSVKYHFNVLRRALSGKENVKFLLTDGKGHNPNYTADAVKYKDGFFAELTKRLKNNTLITAKAKQDFVNSYDWDAMTMQDDEIWNEIFEHLDS